MMGLEFTLPLLIFISILTEKTKNPSVNIIGPCNLGFHVHHDIAELKRLFKDLSIDINTIIPEGASVEELKKFPQAWFNIVTYREVGLLSAQLLQKKYVLPFCR